MFEHFTDLSNLQQQHIEILKTSQVKDEPIEDEITEDNVINKVMNAVLDRVEEQEKELESLKRKYEPVENGVKEFIEISTRTIGGESVNSVSARDLYLDLGFNSSHWAKWAKTNIAENIFFSLGVDFIEFAPSASSPNPAKEYAVSLNMAQHLAMMAKTQRAHDYRNYFIECEKKAHEKTAQIEPPTQSRLIK